jgi:hypothetical protein
MEAVRTFETSVDNYFTRQYIPEDKSEHQGEPRFGTQIRQEESATLQCVIQQLNSGRPRRVMKQGYLAAKEINYE